MKEGGEIVTGHNFREELYLFYPRGHGRMKRFDGVRERATKRAQLRVSLTQYITCCKIVIII